VKITAIITEIPMVGLLVTRVAINPIGYDKKSNNVVENFIQNRILNRRLPSFKKFRLSAIIHPFYKYCTT